MDIDLDKLEEALGWADQVSKKQMAAYLDFSGELGTPLREAARLFLEQQKASDQTEELKAILNNPIVNRDGTLSFAPNEVELIKRALFARARKNK